MVIQNQLLPKSGKVMVSTSATLARLMQVQKVSNAAWPRFGTIIPSNLHTIEHRNNIRRCTITQWKNAQRSIMKTMRWGLAYVMVSPLPVTAKLLRVKKDKISPAT